VEGERKFQGDGAAEPEIVGAIHDAHPTGGQSFPHAKVGNRPAGQAERIAGSRTAQRAPPVGQWRKTKSRIWESLIGGGIACQERFDRPLHDGVRVPESGESLGPIRGIELDELVEEGACQAPLLPI
jgi:hypothetical protein